MTELSREELLVIKEKYDRTVEIATKARLKREAKIRLKLRRYDEGVKSGKITKVTDEEVKKEIKK